MKKTISRVLWIIAGTLLIVSGIICLIRPAIALATIALFLGFVMLISGVIDIAVFVKGHKHMYGTGWFLVDGILTVILSFFLLFNEAFTMLALPLIFGMWLLVSGVSKIVNSLDLKVFGVSGWGYFLVIGIIFTTGGFVSFMNPVAGALTLGSTAGFILILQGCGTLVRAIFTSRFLR